MAVILLAPLGLRLCVKFLSSFGVDLLGKKWGPAKSAGLV
jgi:hypothetical protein